MSGGGEFKVKRGPGRPPGKKKVPSVHIAKSVSEEKICDDPSQRRKRSAPLRLKEFSEIEPDSPMIKYSEVDMLSKSGEKVITRTESPILKRPRGRPPLSAGRGRIVPRRVPGKKSSAYAAYYGSTGIGKYNAYQSYNGVRPAETSALITQKLLSWLMTHDPQSVSEITRGLASSPELLNCSVSAEQVQAIVDVLQVLGIVSAVHTISFSTGLDVIGGKVGSGVGSSKYQQRLYCMKGFAKGGDADFELSGILEDIEKKKQETVATEMRTRKLKELSCSMSTLQPEERMLALHTTLHTLMSASATIEEGQSAAESPLNSPKPSSLAADPLYRNVLAVLSSNLP